MELGGAELSVQHHRAAPQSRARAEAHGLGSRSGSRGLRRASLSLLGAAAAAAAASSHLEIMPQFKAHRIPLSTEKEFKEQV